jgi:hypothetical protein
VHQPEIDMYARATRRSHLGNQLTEAMLVWRPQGVCSLLPRWRGQSLKRVIAQKNGEDGDGSGFRDVPIRDDRDNRGIRRQTKWIPWMGIMIPWLQGELRVAARTAQNLHHIDFTMLVRSVRGRGFRILVGEDAEYRVRIKVSEGTTISAGSHKVSAISGFFYADQFRGLPSVHTAPAA